VVICTYKRPERLAAALKSISVQGFPAEDYEVVIVNNDPEGKDIRALVDRWRGELFGGDEDRLRLVHCPVVGLSYARNAGISESRGEVICFIDDDALAEPDWLQWIWSAFEENREAGVIGGKILLRKPDPAPGWMLPGWEMYWSHFDPQLSGFTTVRHWSQYPWGANWAGRRQSLLETGGFPARGFGRKEGKIQDGGEIAAAALVQRMGYEIGVEPRARVIHAVDPSRFTFRFVWAKIFRSRWRWYQSQVDLYLPTELGVRHAWRRIRLALVPFKVTSLLKVPYALLAEAMTFFWVLRDWLKRMRTPLTMRRD
jgi:glycosyltransferase involved in cell wall biosynthesis